MTDSRLKNATGALMMLSLAIELRDRERADLARAILNECGYPGGEDAPTVAEAVAAIEAKEATA